MNERAPGAPTSAQFEDRVIKIVRGREATAKAKMEDEGWEFVSQDTRNPTHRDDLSASEAQEPAGVPDRRLDEVPHPASDGTGRNS